MIPDSFVLLARLIRPQGRHGELIAEILTDFPQRFTDRKKVWLLSPEAASVSREAEVEHSWLHKGRIVLKLAGVDSIDQATVLSGWQVAVPREQRVPLTDDSVYIDDLIGCRVIDEAAEATDLGPVLDIARGEAGSADLLVLRQGKDELLIPFAKRYIVQIDLAARTLHMRLPDGLTTLNAPLTAEERILQQQMDRPSSDRED